MTKLFQTDDLSSLERLMILFSPQPTTSAIKKGAADPRPGRTPVEVCANVSGNGFNATAARAQVTARCPTVAAVRKELRLIGVRWNRFAANATLKAIMEAALRADMARTLGVASTAIVNGTLVADNAGGDVGALPSCPEFNCSKGGPPGFGRVKGHDVPLALEKRLQAMLKTQ